MTEPDNNCPSCRGREVIAAGIIHEYQRRRADASEREPRLVATVKNFKCRTCGHIFGIRELVE